MSEKPTAIAESYAGGFILAEYTGEKARYCGRSMDWRRQPIIQATDVFESKEEALNAWEAI